MAAVDLNEPFLAKIAGWEAVKLARALLNGGRVLSSNWTPPILKGVVQEGTISYRAGLVIKDTINIENMCSCRQSREWGSICAHSVAVGLHHLNRGEAAAAVAALGRHAARRVRPRCAFFRALEALTTHPVLPGSALRGCRRAPESANSVAMMASRSQRSCSIMTG